MKTVGLVVEYNPLHNGHVYHFEKAKEASGAQAAIAVMSGHFLQRGEPALVNKWARTEMALRMGVDVVIELPLAYACQPAEWFAYGAVRLLDATGVVDSLCFGSEDGRIAPFEQLADALYKEPEAFQASLKEHLKLGVSYPAAYAAAAAEFARARSSEDLFLEPLRLDQPNNSLGLHYLIALRRIGSRMQPLTLARHKAGYHDTESADGTIASATAIRRILEEQGISGIEAFVPPYTLDILRREQDAGRCPITWEHFLQPLIAGIVTRSESELAALHEVTEGLEYRIKRLLPTLALAQPDTVRQFLEALKTKRYTKTKLQRTLLSIVLNRQKHDYTAEKLTNGVAALRVLGFTPQGRELLKAMKLRAKLPIVTKVTRGPLEALTMDLRATAAYAMGYKHCSARDLLRDYYEPPIQLTT